VLVLNYGVQISLKNQFEIQMSRGLTKSTLKRYKVLLNPVSGVKSRGEKK